MKDESLNRELLEERRWERGWAEHETLQRQRLSHLTLSEKLTWLEQAQRMAKHLQASRFSLADNKNPDRD